ncbi:MAG: cupin domain-containing protein [Chloroflexi bacterium]|nr:cupin domain-containing protein [Chloroflexota bacterium]
MAEREVLREKEAEPKLVDLYEETLRTWTEARERAVKGRVVVRGREAPWRLVRQGIVKHYLHPGIKDTAIRGWTMFIHEIRTHSGRHRHQGSLALFVLEGEGYTVVDGVRHDWEKGDLILLPIKPGGCEHQHFNAYSSGASRWLALRFDPFFDALGNYQEQIEVSPDWKKSQ